MYEEEVTIIRENVLLVIKRAKNGYVGEVFHEDRSHEYVFTNEGELKKWILGVVNDKDQRQPAI
jgi:hypothetical protein